MGTTAAATRFDAIVIGRRRYINTDIIRDMMARRGPEILARVPLGEMGKPDDIAEMVFWLSSERSAEQPTMSTAASWHG